MFVQIIPFDRSFDDLGFTYLVPDFLENSVFV
jgi:hypothetical protein